MRPASTVVLARARTSGDPELLFVRRPEAMRFLGGFHAFPGGALDPGDLAAEAFAASALSPGDAESIMGEAAGDQPALGFFICALRELFEEVGILLVSGDIGASRSSIDSARRDLLEDRATIGEVAKVLDVTLATDSLRFLARWVAPEVLPIRFDVRVFVAAAVGEPDPDPGEVDRIDWLSASEALALTEAGGVVMAPPTVSTVYSLTGFSSVEEMVQGTRREHFPTVERHSPLVRRIVAPNPSIMTGPGTNTWIVGDGEVIVIDPGSMEPDHLDVIASCGKVTMVVITHHHVDHVSGVLELAQMTGVPIAASPSFFQRTAMEGKSLVEGDVIGVPAAQVRVLETPGHASGHLSFWLESERALFSGDLVLGEGTTVISPPDGDLVQYMKSLEKVLALDPARIYPGHFGPRVDAVEWITFYRDHRIQREDQILASLGESELSAAGIVERVYSGYPTELHPIAERTVLAHLAKLAGEGRVVETGGTYRIPHE